MMLITCITPTFNRANLLEKAIESNLNQTYKEWEQIIVDDNSTDNTEELVYRFSKNDSRIKYFKNSGKGASSARNLGFEHSNGDYITYLDDDNLNLPHRFESQSKAVLKSKSNYIVSGYEARELGNEKSSQKFVAELKGMASGNGQRWIISREILQRAGGWDPEMPAMQEVDLSYRMAQIETYIHHNDIITVLYSCPDSISRVPETSINGKIKLMEKHSKIMPDIEAAWWYINISFSLFSVKDFIHSRKYLQLAYEREPRSFEKILLNLKSKIPDNYRSINKIYIRFVSKMYYLRYPELVKHKIIEK